MVNDKQARKEGWYRVFTNSSFPILMEWDGKHWLARTLNGDILFYNDNQMGDIDPKMVMTPTGKMVYHK